MNFSEATVNKLGRYMTEGTKAITKEDIERFFGPLLQKHRDYITEWVSKKYTTTRKEFLAAFPNEEAIRHGRLGHEIRKLDYPDSDEVADFYKDYKYTGSYRPGGPEDMIIRKYPLKDYEGYNEFYQLFDYGREIYDAKNFKNKLNKIIKETISMNEGKLINAFKSKLDGFDIESVDEVNSKIGNQGIEGAFVIHLTNGETGNMTTQSIYAGGYNIQRLHFRYLIKISKSLEGSKVVVVEDLTPNEIAVIKIMKDLLATGFDIKEKIPLEARRAVLELKGQTRNYGPFVKKGYIKAVEEGRYVVKRFNYFITPAGAEYFRSN